MRQDKSERCKCTGKNEQNIPSKVTRLIHEAKARSIEKNVRRNERK